MFFYTYDANGNRVLVDGTESYTTGDNNQTASDGTYTYLYDDEGNLRFRLIDGGDPTADAPNAGDTDITEFTWDHREITYGMLRTFIERQPLNFTATA